MRALACRTMTAAILTVLAAAIPSSAAPPEIAAVSDGTVRYQAMLICGENFEPGQMKSHAWLPKVVPVPDVIGPTDRVLTEEEKREWRNRSKQREGWQLHAADTSLLGKPAPPLPETPPEGAQTNNRFLEESERILGMHCNTGIPQAPQCHVLWLENGDGLSKPFLVNRPKAWWLDKESAAPGDLVRMIGRNLNNFRFGLTTLAMRNTATGETTLCRVGGDMIWGLGPYERAAYVFRVQFEVPPDLPGGDYEVYLHNGSGDRWGWSDALPLAVRVPEPDEWDVVNVRDFGAAGDGQADDTAAFEKAIDAAVAKAPAWIYAPAGLYCVTRTLPLPANTGLRGDGMANTILTAHPDRPFLKKVPPFMQHPSGDPGLDGYVGGFAGSEYTALLTATSGCRFERLSMQCGNRTEWTIVLHDPEGEIHDVRVRYAHFGPPREHWHWLHDHNALRRGPKSGMWFFGPSRNVEVLHSRFEDATLSCTSTGCYRWRVAYCDFEGKPGNYYGLLPYLKGARNCVIEHCRAEHPSRGWVQHGGGVHNLIFNNTVEQSRGDGGGEPFLFEGVRSTFVGQATGADANGLTVEGAGWTPGAFKGMTLVIAKGRGFGQYAFITDNTADRVQIDRSWTVTPDETTVFSFGDYYTENLLMANTDINGFISHYYGNCIGNVWALHRSIGGLGFAFAGFLRTNDRDYAPVLFNELRHASFRRMRGMLTLRGNTLVPNRYGLTTTTGNRLFQIDTEDAPIVLWERWIPAEGRLPWMAWQTVTRIGWRMTMERRHNAMDRPEAPPSVTFNIVEQCGIDVEDGEPEIYIGEGCANNILRDNHIFDSPEPARIERYGEAGDAE